MSRKYRDDTEDDKRDEAYGPVASVYKGEIRVSFRWHGFSFLESNREEDPSIRAATEKKAYDERIEKSDDPEDLNLRLFVRRDGRVKMPSLDVGLSPVVDLKGNSELHVYSKSAPDNEFNWRAGLLRVAL